MFDSIDPTRAWAPRPDGPLSWAEAAHLHRRTGFGATPGRIRMATQRPLSAELEAVFAVPDEAFEADQRLIAKAVLAGGKPRRLSAWWLQKMARSPAPLREHMALFWHGHFASSAAKVGDLKLMFRQYESFYQLGLGSFRELVLRMVEDPAMLTYLDATENLKNRPNENLARELMELFTLGVDRYSEADIKELARCLTGWQVRFGRAKFVSAYHDSGRKTLLGKSGAFTSETAVDVLLRRSDCGHHIARKLVRHFVVDGVPIPRRLTEPLAKQFVQEPDVGQLLRTILASRLFYSETVRGQKIKSPVAFAMGLLRSFGAATNFEELANQVALLGQDLFQPPSVKGWPGGTTWINASTQLGRCNLAAALISDKEPGITPARIAAQCSTREELELLPRLLFAQPISTPHIPVNNSSGHLLALTTYPEFQLA